MAGPAYHGRTHMPGGTDPIPTIGSGWPHLYDHPIGIAEIVDIQTGTSPDVSGFATVGWRGAPAEDLVEEGDIIFGSMTAEIDGSPGAVGADWEGGTYSIYVSPYSGVLLGDVGAWPRCVGWGYTAPGGVPYQVMLVSGSYDQTAVMLVPGVTDPDAATFRNLARPDWPGTYADGDLLFAGGWMFRANPG
jgi:hypothetical protein